MAFKPEDHMMDLKGKLYLQVMWRLVWFREEHPDWCINTELVSLDKETNTAIFKAEIMEPHTEQVLSTGYGSECVRDFKDFLEKAETKAVGRALAMLGYGTQFAPDLDEGERIVDSPVPAKEEKKEEQKKKPVPQLVQRRETITEEEAKNLKMELDRADVNLDKLLQREKVKSLIELTPQRYLKIMGQLDEAFRNKEQSNSGTGNGGPGPGEGVRSRDQGTQAQAQPGR